MPPAAPPPDREVEALLNLLEDEDPKIHRAAARRLLEIEPRARTAVERAADRPGPAAGRAANVLREWHWARLGEGLRRLAEGEAIDLEAGALLISALDEPGLDPDAIRRTLDGMAAGAARRIPAGWRPSAAARALAEYLHGELGFQGSEDDYLLPESSYIHRVLERRRGIPISLSLVWLFVGRRLGLPLEGVGFPSRFLVGWRAGGERLIADPFGGGRLLTRDQCRELAAGLGAEWTETYLDPTPPREILARMVRNLHRLFETRRDARRRELLGEWLLLLASPEGAGIPERP